MSLKNATSIVFATVVGTEYTPVASQYFKENYSLPVDAPPWAIRNPRWSDSGGAIYGVFCILAIVTTLIFAVLVYCYRDNIIVKASSALTIKNYRIYRIFNSVDIANQKFQTRLLVRYVALAAVLCTIPIIIEVIVESPKPGKLNIHNYQWVRCRGVNAKTWWYPVGAIVPIILVISGVFLAYRTRNIAYLWNEARQIAIVLYNVFFFLLIIGISQFFPIDLYTVTFDLTIILGYIMALISLVNLFVPKFWKIWKQHRAIKAGIPIANINSMDGRLGFGDFLSSNSAEGSATARAGAGAGAGAGFPNPGGFLGPSAMCRMPDDLHLHLEAAEKSAPDTAVTSENSGRSKIQNHDQAGTDHLRRESQDESLMSLSEAAKRKGNPITVWMNANIRKRKKNQKYEAKSQRHVRRSDPEDFIGLSNNQRSKSRQPQDVEKGRSSMAAPNTQDEASDSNSRPQQRVNTSDQMSTTLRGGHNHVSRSGAQRMSQDEKSTSYLMLSMTQATYDGEPVIRITTSNSGTILIRFPDQDQLDGWMHLFSEEDRAALSTGQGSKSSPSSLSTGESTARAPNESQAERSSTTGAVMRNRASAKASRKDDTESGLETVHFPTTENVYSIDQALNTIGEPEFTSENAQTLALVKVLTEGLAQEEVPVLAPELRQQQASSSENSNIFIPGDVILHDHNIDQAKSVSDIIQQYRPESSTMTDGSTYNIPIIRNTQNPSTVQTGIDTKEENDGSVEQSGNNTSLSSHEHLSLPPKSLHPLSIPTDTSGVRQGNGDDDDEDDDDDDEDLYDPEFGIGGNGRRRHRNKSVVSKEPIVPSAEVISTAAAAVSAGWSASNALSAAMADPSGGFLPSSTVNRIAIGEPTSPIPKKSGRDSRHFSFFGRRKT
ncbi:hypothetical protein BGZ49_009434 [Haplosporangium sp. Z 27]|nr:hypothetical protein BGZ49_009434 [Haplosporangium sp. Z 27]